MTKLEKILQKNTVVYCKNEGEIEYLYNLVKNYLTPYDKEGFLFRYKNFLKKDRKCYNFHFRADYTICWWYNTIDYFREKNYKIIECEDLMMEDKDKKFTKDDLKNGDVILKRNGSVEILVNKTLVRKIGSNILSAICNDLTSNDGYRFDIIQVRRPLKCTDINFNAFKCRKGELVYDRTTLPKLWNGMTYEQAHRKLWNMLADDPKLCKDDVINIMNKNGEENPHNNCFACENTDIYKNTDMFFISNCQKCPLTDKPQNKCLNGLFAQYNDSTGFTKASYAKQIAELPWIEK